jgi:hypothetical protein
MNTINISQKEVAAMRAYKTDVKTMAEHFGISIKDMRDVLVKFGFAKPTKTTTDYTINLNFDFVVNKVDDLPSIDSLPVNNTLNYSETLDAFSSNNN